MYGPPLHALFLLLGTGAAVAVFLTGAKERRRLDWDLLTVLGGALFGGSVGAKLGAVGVVLLFAAIRLWRRP